MAILSKGTDFSTGDQVTAVNLDALVDSATFAAGAVDNTTTALDSSSPQKIIVKNGGIGTTQLATSSSTTTGVTFAKMQHVASGTVLANSTSSEGDISALAVADTKIIIGNGSGLTAAALSGDATMTNAGAVTIANDAVTNAKLADDAVTNAKLADDAVNSAQIENGAIDLVHMSANSVDSDQYVNGSIDLVHMGNNSVDSNQYVDGSIDKVHIAAGALTDLVYPVGSIFTTVNNYANSAAVVNAIGGTTWTAFGSGRVLVGQKSSDSNFNVVEEEGGASTVTLTSAQSGVPAHAHKFQITGDSTPDSGTTGGIMVSGTGSTANGVTGTPSDTSGRQIGGNTASDAASSHTNLQPYVVVYMWKRTN